MRNIISYALLFLLLIAGGFRSYGFDGQGTELSPYQIKTAKELRTLSEQVRGGQQYEGKHFVQTANIDLQGEPWQPIGTEELPFLGSFDGAGYTISNLVISGDRSSRLGLFGQVGRGGAVGSAYISGIRLDMVSIIATRKVEDLAIGALAGEVRSGYAVRGCGVKIRNVSYESNEGGTVSLGGLIGIADGCELWDCWTEKATKDGAIRVQSSEACYVGGLLGRFEGFAMEKTKAQVQRAFSDVQVRVQSDNSAVGGFVGMAQDVWVADCFSMGNVSATKGDAASFIGRMHGSGNCCYTTGKLSVNGNNNYPLMMASGGEDCDNFYYKEHFDLFRSGSKEKNARKFSDAAIKGEMLPEGFSQRNWELHSGQPPILKLKIGGMAVR